MKYVIVLGDGMADEPIAELGNKTPLQVAHTPSMDLLAKRGRSGILYTVPQGVPPGSEVANLAVLGYDVKKVLEGRGSLEAASMGIAVEPNELVMRCNLICVADGKIKNHSAGHISSEEAAELINFLNDKLSDERLHFFPGVSYRHVMKLKGGDKRLLCTPPHDIPGMEFAPFLIREECESAHETAILLNKLTLRSQELLLSHPINQKRTDAGKDPANSIWLWSPGYKPAMTPLAELFPINSGAVISAVDLIKGIGVYAGLEVIEVEGATGLYNTNYEGKAEAALRALKKHNFVYVHVEASDEAGHEGDADMKIRTIEYLDERLLKRIMEETSGWDEPVTIALLPDHPTPCRTRTHTADPVPFVIYNPTQIPDNVDVYDEFAATQGAYGVLRNDEFIRLLFLSPDLPNKFAR